TIGPRLSSNDTPHARQHAAAASGTSQKIAARGHPARICATRANARRQASVELRDERIGTLVDAGFCRA
ncbi:hypothetical protein, partial [Escherichia coli]|uniref:hypothetical protein n=1 Tax=Escherichia coli TaxID=562 RepID=UPI0019D71D90